MKYVEKIFNAIFNFYTLFFAGIGALAFLIMATAHEESIARQEFAAACYDLQMVDVQTDAGPRCVAPEYLVEAQ